MMADMPKRIRLLRTGEPPLVFFGTLLGQVGPSERERKSNKALRWHELSIYVTQAGQYVAYIAYCTDWRGEHDHYSATITPDLAGAAFALTVRYDPREHVEGYPPLPKYRQHQSNLLDWICRRYTEQVGELLYLIDYAEVIG